MGRLPRAVTMTTNSTPQPIASSTLYWMMGLFRRGSISLGWDLVTGRNLVPHPAAVITAFLMRVVTGTGYLRFVFRRGSLLTGAAAGMLLRTAILSMTTVTAVLVSAALRRSLARASSLMMSFTQLWKSFFAAFTW